MKEKLQLLKEKINKEAYKEESKNIESFGGAGLIVTHKGDKRTADVVVFTKHEKELSWLVYELKEIFVGQIDYINKYSFYPRIGELANEYISQNGDEDISAMMNYILNAIGE